MMHRLSLPARHLVRTLAFGLATLPLSASAGEVVCPDLAEVVQVAPCPTEEELLFTYTGYCSDDRRMYVQGPDVCKDYQLYRKFKNIALWETKDGAFHAYLSCDLPEETLRQAKPRQISVGKDGKMTRVACTYGPDIVFAYRSREACRSSETASACATDPAACKAICE